MTAAEKFSEIYFTVRDGLRLHARHYPAVASDGAKAAAHKRRPVLCLAGLTRNSRDFHRVALALASHPHSPRDVYTLDSRGRGLSEHDKDWKKYTVLEETNDALDFMTMMELFDCGLIGTSRGGLVAMVMAAAQPARVGAVVLNDIGPVIEAQGLMRIAGYVGRTPIPKSWGDAARVVHELSKRDFSRMTLDDAEAVARQLFNDKDGRPAAGYDPAIAKGFAAMKGPMPPLWAQFMALKHAPVLVIRGANSDLLSQATVAQMTKLHPGCTSYTAPEEGHAPLLWDASAQEAIASFFAKADARAHAAAAA